MILKAGISAAFLLACAGTCAAQGWPEPKAPAIPGADGYVVIPNVAVAPDARSAYRVIFDSTRMVSDPSKLLPAVNGAGGVMNDLDVSRVPQARQKFAIVFHGAALDGILDDAHYREKYGMPNPNLPVLAEMRKRGVELFVCGQHLAAEHIDPKILTPLVRVASDAYFVMIAYQNRGYAAMWF
jgi:intracellular sulfur oxidation DsrE/DsrF family protein